MEPLENALPSGAIWKLIVDGKHLKNGAFLKRCSHDKHVTFLTEFSSNRYPKWPVIVAFLNSAFSERKRCFQIPPAQCAQGFGLQRRRELIPIPNQIPLTSGLRSDFPCPSLTFFSNWRVSMYYQILKLNVKKSFLKIRGH